VPRAREIGDEHAVDHREPPAVFWQRCCHEDGNVRMQRPLVRFQLRDPAIAPVPGVLAFPENGPAPRPARVDDDMEDVRAADTLSDSADVVQGKCIAQDGFELVLPGFSLELLRPLVGFPLQVLNLPSHVGELAFFLRVLQAVFVREAVLRLGYELRALLRQPSRDGDLEVRLLALERLFAFPEGQLNAPGLVQFARLLFQLVLQDGDLLAQRLLQLLRRVFLDALAIRLELPFVLLPQRALALAEFGLQGGLDLRTQGARERDSLPAGRAGDGLVGHGYLAIGRCAGMRPACSESIERV
jgi:hypothetical protein